MPRRGPCALGHGARGGSWRFPAPYLSRWARPRGPPAPPPLRVGHGAVAAPRPAPRPAGVPPPPRRAPSPPAQSAGRTVD